jgi:hypothetical protein
MRAVNLLTPDLRSAPKGKGASGPSALEAPGGIGAFVVLGALALVVAAVAGYVLSTNVIADFEQVAKDRAGTVQALAGARFDWEQALRDLSRAMPDDVYLSSLDGDVGGGNGAGSGASSLRGAIQSPAIDLKGCTKSQEAVATLMSRMRNVQGVTRVTLAKSDKDTAATSGSSSVNPCGKGNPPTFEMIVFFERSAVAQALSAATGASDSSSASGSTDSGTAAKDGSASGQQSGKSGSSSSTSQPSSGSTPPAATTTGGTP